VKFLIVPASNLVCIDNQSVAVFGATIPSNVRMVCWSTDSCAGEIEYNDRSKVRVPFIDMVAYAGVMSAWIMGVGLTLDGAKYIKYAIIDSIYHSKRTMPFSYIGYFWDARDPSMTQLSAALAAAAGLLDPVSVLLTANTPWIVPGNVTNGSFATVEGIGAGNLGGGAWARKLVPISLGPGNSIPIQIGTPGAAPDTWFYSASMFLAKGAAGTSAGLASQCIGDVANSGGAWGGTGYGAGGAGGPHGPGLAGAPPTDGNHAGAGGAADYGAGGAGGAGGVFVSGVTNVGPTPGGDGTGPLPCGGGAGGNPASQPGFNSGLGGAYGGGGARGGVDGRPGALLVRYQIGPSGGIACTTLDQQLVYLGPQGLAAVINAIFGRRTPLAARCAQLRSEVAALTTIAAVANYDVTTGWPS